MKKKVQLIFMIIVVLLIIMSNQLISQLTITNTTDYITMEQMFLANEINESGEPWAEALGYNLDDLDPMVPNQPDSISYSTGIEAYEYSRYQLGTIISRSGMGLHMMWSPMIGLMASMAPEAMDGKNTPAPNGFKEDDVLLGMIKHLGQAANFTPFKNPWPQFAEFIKGDPHLPQPIAEDFTTDFKTLRWDRSKMDKTLSPGAMGQTLMKQYLWAQDMLGSFHDENEDEVVPDGIATPDSLNGKYDPSNNIYLGGDNADGFIGQVLTAEAINKILFLINKLAFDGTSLGAVNPQTYNPMDGIKYFPHKIAITEEMVMAGLPPKLNSMDVTDKSSYLFDQLSLLWGTLNFRNMMNPADSSDEAHIAYKSAFDGDPFPPSMSQTGVPGPFDLMMGASKVLFMNIAAMHFDEANKTFVDISTLENGAIKKGAKISSVSAGYIIVILKKMEEEFKGTPIEGKPTQLAMAQANFIINNLKDDSGAYYDFFKIGEGHSNTKSLGSIAAVIRGLYSAYELTGKSEFLTEANNAYDYLIKNYYMPQKMIFKTNLNDSKATYTPFNVALIIGALREANLVGGKTDSPAIYARFSKEIINKMQLAEGANTGETGGDSDNDGIPFIPQQPDKLPPVLANTAVYDILNATYNPVFEQKANLVNYPNPFSTKTLIEFDLDEKSNVSLTLNNLNGQIIQNIMYKKLPIGHHSIELKTNKKLSDGIYFIKLRTDSGSTVKKVIIK